MKNSRAAAVIATWLTAALVGGDRNWEDWIRMGHEAWRAGKQAEALKCWQRAHEDSEVAAHPTSAAALEFNLATALLWFGRTVEAEAGFRKALALQERTYGPSHPDVATTLQSLAVLCVKAGRPAEAKFWVRRSLEIRKNVYGPEHPAVAGSCVATRGAAGRSRLRMARRHRHLRAKL
jgi:tetratricopeptide (TPR) repeat protein